MIRLKLLEYEDNLVRIYTINNYEILDYYKYDPDSGYLMTESHEIELHNSEFDHLEIVNDFVPSTFSFYSNTPKKRSKHMH